jgi:hypothetical protein
LGIEPRNGPASDPLGIAAVIDRVHREVRGRTGGENVLVEELPLGTGIVRAGVIVVVIVGGAGEIGIGLYTPA